MDENNHNYKKKVGIFATVVILAEYLIRSIVNMILSHATALQSADDLYVEKYKMINQGVGVGLSLFSLAFIFLASYIFTKDKRKTVILAGSIYFGEKTASLISTLIISVAKVFTSVATLNTSAQSAIVFAVKIGYKQKGIVFCESSLFYIVFVKLLKEIVKPSERERRIR